MMRYLAIDVGGSRSTGLVVSDRGRLLKRLEGGAANFRSVGPAALGRLVGDYLLHAGHVEGIALSVAGMRTDGERQVLIETLRASGVSSPLAVYSDVESSLRASGTDCGVLLIAGTGVAAIGVSAAGETFRVGGWGPTSGDEGGAYWLGLQILRRAVRGADEGDDKGQNLALRICGLLGMADVWELRTLAPSPDTVTRVSRLAPLTQAYRAEGVAWADELVEEAGRQLGRLVALCHRRLSLPADSPLVVAGGLSRAIPDLPILAARYAGVVGRTRILTEEPALGAFLLAQERNGWDFSQAFAVPATEAPNPRTARIDALATAEMLALINDEDSTVAAAVRACLEKIAELVDTSVQCIRRGGRLIYVGAGTSGRLAVLDAAEVVPTFGVRDTVIAVIAGGATAMTRAVEGAEDDVAAGEGVVLDLGVGPDDIVVGISASGRAPFVRAAVLAAARIGAHTGFITSNAGPEVMQLADTVASVEVGPEVVTGSSRMKSGTAQKLILNMLSTATMIQLGRTAGNRMVGMLPTNQKLRERAQRLVREMTGVDAEAAVNALEQSDWDVRRAVEHLKSE